MRYSKPFSAFSSISVLLILMVSCNYPLSFKNKKLFILYPDKVTVFGASVLSSIQEIELSFISDQEVEIRAIACYSCILADKKNPPSKSVRQNYIYSDGILQIPSLGVKTTLKDSGDKYITEDNSSLYKNSVLDLTYENKSDRINKEFNYPTRIDDFLAKEIIFGSIIKK